MPQTIESNPPTPRSRRWLKWVGVAVINLVLISIIAGLLVATWLPAYIDRHPEIKIGETRTK